MNHLKLNCRLFALLLAAALPLTAAHGADTIRYRAKPIGNLVRIDGVANIHDWAMESTLIGGFFEVPANVVIDSTQADLPGVTDGKLNGTAEVSIRVSSLRNIHGYEGMDNAMQDAMNANTYPWIK